MFAHHPPNFHCCCNLASNPVIDHINAIKHLGILEVSSSKELCGTRNSAKVLVAAAAEILTQANANADVVVLDMCWASITVSGLEAENACLHWHNEQTMENKQNIKQTRHSKVRYCDQVKAVKAPCHNQTDLSLDFCGTQAPGRAQTCQHA